MDVLVFIALLATQLTNDKSHKLSYSEQAQKAAYKIRQLHLLNL